MSNDDRHFFTQELLRWALTHHRPMPWKGEKNPYLIWLSEIILQQTRVEQGLPYFAKFRAAYPTVHDLANASEDEVMKNWEGLGYYSRARNLHFTAQYISRELDGRFPETYETIRALKGVGDYTAAAIAAFAYGLPYAVVDGNVYRVLARFFGIDTPTDTTAGKRQFAILAQELLDQKDAGRYNQAIMDFGASVCTPKAPRCTTCPLRQRCVALRDNQVLKFPVKSKKTRKTERYFQYLVFRMANGDTLIQRRESRDIWRNLYEFPLVESEGATVQFDAIATSEVWNHIVGDRSHRLIRKRGPYRQTLSHRYVFATFWEIELPEPNGVLFTTILPVSQVELRTYAFPKIIDLYFRDNSLTLELF